MIIQSFYKKDMASKNPDNSIIEDNIREIKDSVERIEFIRADGTHSVVRKDNPELASIYLMNDEGKTLQTLYKA